MWLTLEPQFTSKAEVRIPSSKSLGHRALIAAALAEGTSVIEGIDPSADIEATMRALAVWGTVFTENDDTITVTGKGITGTAQRIIDCGESGSTLRFLIPLAALSETETLFTGRGRLMERPQSVYETIFSLQNLTFQRTPEGILVKGPLKPGKFEADGSVSSQFISGLLFALPLLDGDSEITVREPFESSSYVTLTIEALLKAGIRIEQDGCTFRIPGGQKYKAADVRVEGDDSQAAFFAAYAQLRRIPVMIHGVSAASKQPDHVMFSLVRQSGARVRETEDGFLVEGEKLNAIRADLSDCPDLGPVLFAMAAAAEGTSVFTGAGRLRIKESDRIAAMQEELAKLGCQMRADGDTVYVEGSSKIRGGVTLYGHNDHRIVMALSVLASVCENPVIMEGAEAVNKSYPRFFRDLAAAGMKVTYD